MDDLLIIELYFARNELAIKETNLKYGKLCFSVANNILGNTQDSEECVNDTYLSVWNKIPPVRPSNFKVFICKITRNLSLKKLEFKMAMKRAAGIIVSFAELEETLPDDRMNLDMRDEDIGELISNFLRSEKEESRNVFIRRYWFFDSIRDIAIRYSFSESKVKNMLFRSRNRLKAYLEKAGVEI